MPISPDHLTAYFHAATAVAAAHYGVPIRRLSLLVKDRRRRGPELGPLAEFVASQRRGARSVQPYVDYATVLIAGSAGRVLGLEAHLAYGRRCAETARLERAYLVEATLCLDANTDSAYAIIVGWLKRLNGGSAPATIGQLWRRSLLLLRRSPHREQVETLVAALQQRRELSGAEISAILAG